MKWKITKNSVRLPDALVEQLKLSSKKQARRLIDRGQCAINGEIERFASRYVNVGDTIEVLQQDCSEKAQLEILYEDEWIYVLNKPPGRIVDHDSIHKALETDVFLVHRLDRYTSGLLLVAKDKQTQAYFERLFRTRAIKKAYLAIVDGEVYPSKGIIEKPIKKVSEGRFGLGGNKQAVTEYRVVASEKNASLLFLVPQTGRTHQLRLHMKALGCPILGDHQYISVFHRVVQPARQMLHAWKIAFVHPQYQVELAWTAPIPRDMMLVIHQLFGHIKRKLCAYSL